MAVCGLDASVHTMNNEFGALISADLSSCVYGLFLGCKIQSLLRCQLQQTRLETND